MKKILPFLLCLLSSTLLAHGQTLLDVNFQSDTPGQAPSSASSVINVAQGRIIVVDAESNPAHPFQGQGQQSLLIEKTATGQVPTVRWDFSQISNGTALASVYVPGVADGFGGGGAIYLYNNNTLAAGVLWAANGSLSIMTRSTVTQLDEVVPLLSKVLLDEPMSVEITFGEGTFSLSINGELQENASGQTEFIFRGGLSAVDNIRFAQSSTTTVNQRYFLNSVEVKAIPEASSMALLGVFGVGGVFSARLLRLQRGRKIVR